MSKRSVRWAEAFYAGAVLSAIAGLLVSLNSALLWGLLTLAGLSFLVGAMLHGAGWEWTRSGKGEAEPRPAEKGPQEDKRIHG